MDQELINRRPVACYGDESVAWIVAYYSPAHRCRKSVQFTAENTARCYAEEKAESGRKRITLTRRVTTVVDRVEKY